MNIKRRRLMDMLRRVCGFADARASAFPRGTLGARMFDVVGAAVEALEQHAVEQNRAGTAMRSRSRAKAEARSALRAHLTAIHQTSRALALDSPGIDRKFRPPKSRGDVALLGTGQACARHARASRAAFVEHGMPSAFLDELAGAITRFERTARERAGARVAMKKVLADMATSARMAQVAIRRLDAIVPNTFGRDRRVMAAWKRARRVARRGTPPKKGLKLVHRRRMRRLDAA